MKRYGIVKLDIPPHAYGIEGSTGKMITLVPGDLLIIDEVSRVAKIDFYTCRSVDDLSQTRFNVPKAFVDRMGRDEVDEILKMRLK